MNYKVWDGKRGHVFATLAEANAYCNELMRKTRCVFCITETKAKVTHIFNQESK